MTRPPICSACSTYWPTPPPTHTTRVGDTTKYLANQAAGLHPGKASTVVAAGKRNGMEILDTATVDALRSDAQEGHRITAAAAQARAEASVDDATPTARSRRAGGATR
ncbi:hypothetical protein BN971_01836 [Mycobacterium bohemicum DSM 44277]|uniref:Uncharacterized protein n=2 Tax=Mycobacterium bohemicum TaxID=56425 RepID=A0A1X1QX09_MYCBE|nr:hypothetical protein [Mycobacterium bohemicum]ORU95819.1 hypothetical protein AWB93_22855 [Mycobacterium bohemicum]CPR10400.1 hypothetical protein BN971_01836 [Mycobacterium bohemicum DSM 44277]